MAFAVDAQEAAEAELSTRPRRERYGVDHDDKGLLRIDQSPELGGSGSNVPLKK
jgi:hypothetical protein